MPPRPHFTTPARDCNRLWSLTPNKKATFAGGLFSSLLSAGAVWVLFPRTRYFKHPRIRMLKMASQLGRRELGDRSVPLRYVAGRRATENNAGGHFQHPATCPFPRRQDTSFAPSLMYRS